MAHSLSLKVLRLSRPSLATQTPLPKTTLGSSLDIPPAASQAYPSADSSSPLTPLLTLPAAFGAAYVGETFACTLCLNNELPPSQTSKSVSAVRIAALLQTPSNPAGVPLELQGDGEGADPSPGATLQKTLAHDLREPGAHVLAVTVSYTETERAGEEQAASGGRARTFRKLYQFVAQPVLAVRSKVSAVGAEKGRRWVLEAQVENVGEGGVVVERVWLNGGEGIEWRGGVGEKGKAEGVVLKPRDVEQVMFVVEEEQKASGGRALAQVEIDWRSGMGEKGRLTTGWLAARG